MEKTTIWKRLPLTCMIIISTVLVVIISVFATVFGKYKMEWSLDHPLFASVMLKEYKETKGNVLETFQVDNSAGMNNSANGTSEPTSADEGTTQENVLPVIETQYKKTKKKKVNSPYYSDPGKVALTTDYPYTAVDQSYYDDALFIGDSRIEGLHDYSGIDNATYYYKEGLTVYDMMEEKIAPLGGKKTTIKKALKKKEFGKIFIMIGINELGFKTTEDYFQQYANNLNEIQALQPNATIYIMGIMRVTTEYSKSSQVYNNVNINDKNVAIASLANGIDRFYLDMNPVIADKSGGVKAKYTWDGIHLKAEYYQLWVDFLMAHGVVR